MQLLSSTSCCCSTDVQVVGMLSLRGGTTSLKMRKFATGEEKKTNTPHPTGILTVHTKQCFSNSCLLLLSKPVPYPRNCFILFTFILLFMYCSSFKQFLELEPQLRDILHNFYDSKYANCLKLLADIKDNLLLDLYLAPHVAPLYTQIRNRALCQVSTELLT